MHEAYDKRDVGGARAMWEAVGIFGFSYAAKRRPLDAAVRTTPSLVVAPHPQHLDDLLVLYHLVDQPVLDVDASRVRAAQVAHELLIARGRGERVLLEQREQLGGFGL